MTTPEIPVTDVTDVTDDQALSHQALSQLNNFYTGNDQKYFNEELEKDPAKKTAAIQAMKGFISLSNETKIALTVKLYQLNNLKRGNPNWEQLNDESEVKKLNKELQDLNVTSERDIDEKMDEYIKRLWTAFISDVLASFDKFKNDNDFKKLENNEFLKNLKEASGASFDKYKTYFERNFMNIRKPFTTLKPFFDESKDYQLAKKQLEKDIEDAKRGVRNEFSLFAMVTGTETQKTAAKVAFITAAAAGIWAIIAKVQQNPVLTSMAMGGIALMGPPGWVAIGAVLAVSAGYYATLIIKTKFAKYYSLIRTMDEFTILLHKIQKLVRLAVFISTTYKFEVNIDEIMDRLKVVFERFDQLMTDDDYRELENRMSTGASPNLEIAASKASAAVAALDVVGKKNEPSTIDVNVVLPDKSGGGIGDVFKRMGRWITRMTFDTELWNNKLNDDITHLSIYLSTAMGEFNMVLNVIQINLISKSIGGDNDAKTKLITNNGVIEKSGEFKKLLIGILLHDFLKLRTDVTFCSMKDSIFEFPFTMEHNKKKSDTETDKICLEYVEIDPRDNSRYPKYHDLVNGYIEKVKNRLKDEVYANIKDDVQKNVIDVYKKLYDEYAKQSGGWSFFKSNNNSATENPIQQGENATQNEKNDEWYKDHEYRKIPFEGLKKFLEDVYDFSKKESSTSDQERQKLVENVQASLNESHEVKPVTPTEVAAAEATAAAAQAKTGGKHRISRRKKLRNLKHKTRRHR
jgi:hypothetical protein